MPVAAEIFYQSSPARPDGELLPVVLIHGAGSNHLSWPPRLRRLPGCQTLSVDLPGHGLSRGTGQAGIGAYAGAVWDWVQATGLDPAVFAGHSMGSAIALTLALEHPETVRALVLVGAGARLKVAPALLELVPYPQNFSQVIEWVVASSFGPQAPEGLKFQAARRMAETPPAIFHQDFLACNAFDLRPHLPEISQPALVLTGSEDQMTPVRHAEALASGLPNARLEIVPGAGHMLMLERPEETQARVEKFLSCFLPQSRV